MSATEEKKRKGDAFRPGEGRRKCKYCNSSARKLHDTCAVCGEKLKLIRIIRKMGEDFKRRDS